MRKLITILLLSTVVAGCASTIQQKVHVTGSRQLSEDERGFVLKAVQQGLKDPDSAKVLFTPFLETAEGSDYYCGYVNARNSYGGFTGNRIFKASFIKSNGKYGMATAIVDDSPLGQDALREECLEYGYIM